MYLPTAIVGRLHCALVPVIILHSGAYAMYKRILVRSMKHIYYKLCVRRYNNIRKYLNMRYVFIYIIKNYNPTKLARLYYIYPSWFQIQRHVIIFRGP